MKTRSNGTLRQQIFAKLMPVTLLTSFQTLGHSQTLYVADDETGVQPGHIYEYAADGTRVLTLASGDRPLVLAFSSSGNLFATEEFNIYEFSSTGVQSTFASGLYEGPSVGGAL